MIRKAIHSGTFYPRFGYAIISQIASWANLKPPSPTSEKTVALLVPHAGYMYSGAITARAYHKISNEAVDAFVILHPSHHSAEFDFSVSSFMQYETPLGNLLLDSECYAALTEGDRPAKPWLRYHEQEHSMEIQLPMIKYFFPDAKVCPVMLGRQNYDNSMLIAKKIEYLLRQTSRRIVVIASSDLSHYHSADKTKIMDALLAELVRDVKLDELWATVRSGEVEACGIGTILSMMALNEVVPESRLQMLEYAHSGETSGNDSQVVGYLTARLYQEGK